VIDRESGSVIESPNFPGWKQVPLARDVGAALHLPIIIENDANAAAIGEGWIGAARGWYDYLAITLGTGVGGGLVLDKQLWLGPDGAAGEIGHIPVAANGRLCGCGARGCLERYASANGVVESAQEYYLEAGAAWLRDESKNDPRQVTAKMINDGANAGDAFCLKLLSDAGERLGQMMGITALLLNVTQFVVGGGMAGALPHLERGMRTAALRTAYTLDHSILEIVPAALGDNAGLIGAAKLAFEMTSVR
jgi:glucokinase